MMCSKTVISIREASKIQKTLSRAHKAVRLRNKPTDTHHTQS